MSRTSIHISIPTPCHESWDSMDTTERGAFCHSCQKEVIDFSAMTDREVIEFLEKHKTGCGRFRADQLDTKLTIPRLDNGVFRWRALFLGLGSLISVKNLFASTRPNVLQSDTSTKNINDSMTSKEVPIYPYRKVGEISVVKPKDSVYQISNLKVDSIPTPNKISEGNLTVDNIACVAGMVSVEKPSSKIKYWFRRTFRIKPKH